MTKPSRIPVADPARDQAHLNADIMAAIEHVIAEGNFVLGAAVKRLESELAHRLGVTEAVGVASGTDALVLALAGLGIASRDEVITVSHTAGPTVAAIRMVGATPVFVDIEIETYCLDPARLEAAISPQTKCIIVVHLYGHPADLNRIIPIAKKHDIPVIEDCAQAQEATIDQRQVGSIGAVGCFSFYPTKSLGAIGDGGLAVTQDNKLGQRLRKLRTYGWSDPQFAELCGGRCSRLDELQAAVLSVKLSALSKAIEKRRSIAHFYQSAFADLPIIVPSTRPNCRHVYHLFVIRTDRRDALIKHLDTCGVSAGIHYPYPIHTQPGLAVGARIPEPLRVTESISSHILSLPLFPSMTSQQQERVATAVRAFFRKY
jgi:dTDP-4-amino-4,6-dideoxygalactose transaminase